MNRLSSLVIFVAAACAPQAGVVPMPEPSSGLSWEELWPILRAQARQPPLELDAAAFARLRTELTRVFTAAKRGALAEVVVAAAELEGMGYASWPLRLSSGQGFAVVDPEHGGGGCLVRVGEVAAELWLQTPHSYFDRGTGQLGGALFEAAPLRGFCFNTAHRHGRVKNVAEAEPAADAAHNPSSPLSAQTLAALAAGLPLTVIQLHGFDVASVPTEVDVIVSAGASNMARARDLAALAWAGVGARVKRFPEEIALLGGTENAQGRLVAVAGAGFVHVEMSAAQRERLLAPAAGAELAAALARLFGSGADR